MTSTYNHKQIEEKWTKRWDESKSYEPDLAAAKKPFYNLMMFPYPSAEGLHIGNLFAFVGSDIQGRYRKALGYDVFEPMGSDAFGIHSENYALKTGTHPWHMIPKNIERFREEQLKRTGNMFDWSHELDTTDPDYYRWTQWIFLQLFNKGLAYRKNAEVNWCPSCKTVLANEQVEDTRCERCDNTVEQRTMEQWFFRITAYAQKLLDNLEWIDWSETTKNAQRNWIGRSDGVEITFVVTSKVKVSVFTTRPDTLWGATFLVLAPEHPLVRGLTTPEHMTSMEAYLKECMQKRGVQKEDDKKSGVFTGSHAIHPATGDRIPIWVSDYVLMSYGSGAIMAVPAHDERDFDFARTYNLPIVQVISSDGKIYSSEKMKAAYSGDGFLVNSGPFSGTPSAEAKTQITQWLSQQGIGKAQVRYRLHDWCISRQRYWGTPIPIVNCDRCGTVPVPEEDLPVLLPYLEQYQPDGTGKSPLARDKDFLVTQCPRCQGPAKRETDVMDNFVDSSWYFLRYPSSKEGTRAFDDDLIKKWLPVDLYIGGNEHAVRHLLYTRFITMVLHDIGSINFSEPFKKFRAHGIIVKDGAKMSKSKGNVINPDEYLDKYGADVFRTYLMFSGDYRQGGDFRDENIVGVQRFFNRLWRFVLSTGFVDGSVTDREALSLMHKTVKKVTEDIESLHYNTAIAVLMEFLQGIVESDVYDRDCIVTLVKLVAPFAPFIAHELWERIGGEGIASTMGWPSYDSSLTVDETIEFVIQVNGKVRDKAILGAEAEKVDVKQVALKSDKIQSFIRDKRIEKVIFVPGRLLNIVVR